MEAKFKVGDTVIVNGTATGYGDLTGTIREVALVEMLKVPYYNVSVKHHGILFVYVAEQFITLAKLK